MQKDKKALIITTVSGFLIQFELSNVQILQDMGYEVHYASNFQVPVYLQSFDYKKSGINIHPVPIQKKPWRLTQNIKAFFNIRSLVKRENFQLIHCHTPMGGVMGRLVTIGMKHQPWILYTAHGFHFYKGAPMLKFIPYYIVERILALRTNCLITVNQEDYDYATKFQLRKNSFVRQIPGVGVSIDRFSANISKVKRCDLNIPEDSLFLLSVGEINRNKNHITVLRAVAKLRNPRLFYGICGSGNANYVQYLKEEVSKLGIEQQVCFFGYQSEVTNYLNLVDVFIFPSIREGLGMAALEAMAAGLPIIAADNRGTREYMVDGYNGFVVSPLDVQGFADAIVKMQSVSFRKRAGLNSRKQVQKFGKEHVNSIMKQIYQESERRMKDENHR
ncbi:MAG: glycosyltransferase family 4 protein [Lachnospiraceae bacterium]|nr:glycosyltransferase family 4 protein [Lachnospiraceae bacterium]